MPSTVDISDVIEAALDSSLGGLYVAEAGRVEKYFPETLRANVVPVVSRKLDGSEGGYVFEKGALLPSVPVMWPRCGAFAMVGELVEGDTGLIVYASVPWGEWLATGQDSEHVDVRRHSIGYAAFLPGLYPNPKPLASAKPINGAKLSIGEHTPNGAAIGFRNGEIIAGGNTAEALAYHAELKALAVQLKALIAGLSTGGPAPLTGPALATAMSGVGTACDDIISSVGTTVLKGK